MSARIPWESGSLWQKLKAQTAHGLSTGDLQPIKTEIHRVEECGIRFIIYVLSSISRKEKARKEQGKTKPANPFLPYEQDLYVTDISDSHLCLLNKFNVVDHHFLIVTREYESQENWINLADFEALTKCLAEVDGLAFFNGGKVAGASQPHKHLQVLPRIREMSEIPIEKVIKTAKEVDGVMRSPLLPFKHAALLLQKTNSAKQYLDTYHQLLEAVGITSNTGWQGEQTAPYNFLCTQRWMMIVPRSQEKYADISVNSLGFAGSLLVRDQEKLSQLKEIKPIELLKHVAKD